MGILYQYIGRTNILNNVFAVKQDVKNSSAQHVWSMKTVGLHEHYLSLLNQPTLSSLALSVLQKYPLIFPSIWISWRNLSVWKLQLLPMFRLFRLNPHHFYWNIVEILSKCCSVLFYYLLSAILSHDASLSPWHSSTWLYTLKYFLFFDHTSSAYLFLSHHILFSNSFK